MKTEMIRGNLKTIINHYKKIMNKIVSSIDLFDEYAECNDIEDKQRDINLILEVINGLYQDYITEYIEKDTIIIVMRDESGELSYELEKEN